MVVEKETTPSQGIKIVLKDNGEEIGRVFLYLIYNGLHEKPYGLMEDLFVQETYRGQGHASRLITALIEEAKAQGCYKLIGQSRYGKDDIHAMYEKRGFVNHGYNFRMNLS